MVDEQQAWQTRMARRLDASTLDCQRLVNSLLTQHWMHECAVIPDYMPPYPHPDTRPRCVVRYTYTDGGKAFLRYSKGPLQGYFWDGYGEDMHSPELAIVALSQSPPPPRVDVCIPTHGA